MEQREYEKGRRRVRFQKKKNKKDHKEEKEKFFERCEFDSQKCVNCHFFSQCYDLEMQKNLCWNED